MRSGQIKLRTFYEILMACAYVLERQNKHLVFKRTVLDGEGRAREQTFTMSCTPSDRHSWKAMVTTLLKLDLQAAEWERQRMLLMSATESTGY